MIELDKIYNIDMLKGIANIPDESIDLVVTDPPYRTISGGNKNKKWKSGYENSVLCKNDGKVFDYNNIEIRDYMRECYRVLKYGAHAYFMTNLLNLFEMQRIGIDVGFKLHNLLVWEKNTANANRWYMKNCEYTLFFRKGEARTINYPSSKTVHRFDNPVGNKYHPTEKPVCLMKLYITNSSNQGDIILDPFAGAGSTLIAARDSGRRYIGFEIDKKYYDIAVKRLRSNEKQLDLF